MTVTKSLFAAHHPDHGLRGSRWEFPILIAAVSEESADDVVRSLADTDWEISPAGDDWRDALTDEQRAHLDRVGWVEVR